MKIRNIILLPQYEEKIAPKHNVTKDEIESLFANRRKDFFWEYGDRTGEDFYSSLSRSSDGRYIAVFFILKLNGDALIISARDMDDKERKRYGKK
ncbi:MAG: BrnT family toxin [Candidatus Riflebacteria bacterium]|nr:BrnT family toxin [Candidatus Riflebacteria bacterium]